MEQKVEAVSRTRADDLLAAFGTLARSTFRGPGRTAEMRRILHGHDLNPDLRAHLQRNALPEDAPQFLRDALDDFIRMTDPELSDLGPIRYGGHVWDDDTFGLTNLDSDGTIVIHLNPKAWDDDVLLHELGHAIEIRSLAVFDEAVDLLRRHTHVGDDIHYFIPNRSGAFDRLVGRKRKYVGKIYRAKKVAPPGMPVATLHGIDVDSTEVVSLSMGMLRADPVEFHKRAPEYFWFMFKRILRRRDDCVL